jgi:hypothetical protein
MKAEIALDKLHAERKWNSSGAHGDRHKRRHKRGALGADPNFWAEERTLLVICTFVFIFDVLTVYWVGVASVWRGLLLCFGPHARRTVSVTV